MSYDFETIDNLIDEFSRFQFSILSLVTLRQSQQAVWAVVCVCSTDFLSTMRSQLLDFPNIADSQKAVLETHPLHGVSHTMLTPCLNLCVVFVCCFLNVANKSLCLLLRLSSSSCGLLRNTFKILHTRKRFNWSKDGASFASCRCKPLCHSTVACGAT